MSAKRCARRSGKDIDRSLSQLPLPAACDLERPSLKPDLWRRRPPAADRPGPRRPPAPLRPRRLPAGLAAARARRPGAAGARAGGRPAAGAPRASERIDELTLFALAAALALALPSAAAAAASARGPGGRLYRSLLRAVALAAGGGARPGRSASRRPRWARETGSRGLGRAAAGGGGGGGLRARRLAPPGAGPAARRPPLARARSRAGAAAPPAAGLERARGARRWRCAASPRSTASGNVHRPLRRQLHPDPRHRRPAGAERRRQDHPAARAHRPAGAHPRHGAPTGASPITADNLAEYRRRIGFLPQEFNAYPGFTAEQFLDHWALERGLSDPRQRRAEIERLLAAVGLAEHAGRKVRDYSGGMRQRVGIARALLARAADPDRRRADHRPRRRVARPLPPDPPRAGGASASSSSRPTSRATSRPPPRASSSSTGAGCASTARPRSWRPAPAAGCSAPWSPTPTCSTSAAATASPPGCACSKGSRCGPIARPGRGARRASPSSPTSRRRTSRRSTGGLTR